ncbi:MAG TPA: EamA family transporter [Vicinamibacterales bacterium]|nr:EamA family transporter [Vicinamibacterales bacterium]
MSTHGAAAATRSRAWSAWLVVCVVWGTTYLAIKVALETIPPFVMGGLRYVIAGALLAAILRARGHRLPARSTWGTSAVISLFMIGFGNGGVVWAEQSVPSGLTAVLIGTSPFWMTGVDALLRTRQRPHARQWIGLAIGFLGIVILVLPDVTAGGEVGRNFGWGVVAVQLACAGWAVGSAYTKRHTLPGDVLGSAALQMIFGGIIMMIAATVLGEWPHVSWNTKTTAAFAYLTIFGSLIAFACFSYALKHMDVAIVSLYSYVNPVIAVALGTLLLGEPFNVRMLVAAAVIVAGILVVRQGNGP